MNPREYVVLLADDDPNDVFLLQRAFQKTNIANPLHVVRDGEEAMAYLSGQDQYADRQRHPLPVLLLLDLKMPRKSGFEVLRWVRQQSGLKRLPVVVLVEEGPQPHVDVVHSQIRNRRGRCRVFQKLLPIQQGAI